jgi:hypothetical protein
VGIVLIFALDHDEDIIDEFEVLVFHEGDSFDILTGGKGDDFGEGAFCT